MVYRNYLRVRGEYANDDSIMLSKPELPPRARRIHWVSLAMMGCTGTTSACAENTARAGNTIGGKRNYLRVRGEYSSLIAFMPSGVELPPRARRIRSPGSRFPQHQGTTSACAENTEAAQIMIANIRNYLRVRGEYKLV